MEASGLWFALRSSVKFLISVILIGFVSCMGLFGFGSMARAEDSQNFVLTNKENLSLLQKTSVAKKIDLRKLVKYDEPKESQRNYKYNSTIREWMFDLKSHGGTNGAGGGSGVICLKDTLKEITLDNIKELHLQEFWEWTQQDLGKEGRGFVQPKPEENAEQFLNRLLFEKYESLHSPFIPVLKQAISKVFQQLYEQQREQKKVLSKFSSLDYHNDRGVLFWNDQEYIDAAGCKSVQIAWRELDESKMTGHYKISFNLQLYNNLGRFHFKTRQTVRILQQAMLILHEALYLLGDQLKSHSSSYHIRFLTNLMFFGPLDQMLKTGSSTQFRYLLYAHGFDGYQHFATGERDKVTTNKLARREAYQNVIMIFGNLRRIFFPIESLNVIFDSQFVRNPMISLREKNIYLAEDWFSPEFNVEIAYSWYRFILENVVPDLSSEESLVLLGRIYFDQIQSALAVNSQFRDVQFDDILIDRIDDHQAMDLLCGKGQTFDQLLTGTNQQLVTALRRKIQSLCD